jgi:hypothetical protein
VFEPESKTWIVKVLDSLIAERLLNGRVYELPLNDARLSGVGLYMRHGVDTTTGETWVVRDFGVETARSLVAQREERFGDALEVCRVVASGVAWLHERHQAHGDIRSDNVVRSARFGWLLTDLVGSELPFDDARQVDVDATRALMLDFMGFFVSESGCLRSAAGAEPRRNPLARSVSDCAFLIAFGDGLEFEVFSTMFERLRDQKDGFSISYAGAASFIEGFVANVMPTAERDANVVVALNTMLDSSDLRFAYFYDLQVADLCSRLWQSPTLVDDGDVKEDNVIASMKRRFGNKVVTDANVDESLAVDLLHLDTVSLEQGRQRMVAGLDAEWSDWLERSTYGLREHWSRVATEPELAGVTVQSAVDEAESQAKRLRDWHLSHEYLIAESGHKDVLRLLGRLGVLVCYEDHGDVLVPRFQFDARGDLRLQVFAVNALRGLRFPNWAHCGWWFTPLRELNGLTPASDVDRTVELYTVGVPEASS